MGGGCAGGWSRAKPGKRPRLPLCPHRPRLVDGAAPPARPPRVHILHANPCQRPAPAPPLTLTKADMKPRRQPCFFSNSSLCLLRSSISAPMSHSWKVVSIAYLHPERRHRRSNHEPLAVGPRSCVCPQQPRSPHAHQPSPAPLSHSPPPPSPASKNAPAFPTQEEPTCSGTP